MLKLFYKQEAGDMGDMSPGSLRRVLLGFSAINPLGLPLPTEKSPVGPDLLPHISCLNLTVAK